MAQKGYWVIRTFQAGEIAEKIKYFVPEEKPTRSARKMSKDIRKLEQNARGQERHLARLLNENFRKGDYLLGLDYSEEGMRKVHDRMDEDTDILDAAEQELRNCIRRVKRAMEKECPGEEIRYVAVTSDMDGETGEVVRVHHHIVISANALPFFLKKWKLGGVAYAALSGEPDRTAIAAYMLRQVRHRENAKKFTPSRNLHVPKPVDRIAISGAELRVPRGGALLYRGAFIPGYPQYIRYIRPPEGYGKKTA